MFLAHDRGKPANSSAIKQLMTAMANSSRTKIKRAAGYRCALAATYLVIASVSQAHGQALDMVSMPNGTYDQTVVDLKIQTAAGEVSWQRAYNGTGWRFNRHWDGISATYKPLATQSTGGGAGSSVPSLGSTGEGQSGCWVWVDEDFAPTGAEITLDIPDNTFNHRYPQDPQSLAALGVAACGYLGTPAEVTEGFRRVSSPYGGSKGTYVFKNRYTLKKQNVLTLSSPTQTGGLPLGGLPAEPRTGSVDLSQARTVDGWRWQDRKGDWAEYDENGQISRYGDRNDNVIWIQRNSQGWIERVIDGGNLATTTVGQTALTLHYTTTGRLLQVKDYPQTGNSLDLPQRTVSYGYDVNGLLTTVTDVRGNTTTYTYDTKKRLVTVADPEGRV